jgi:hypothetical protein
LGRIEAEGAQLVAEAQLAIQVVLAQGGAAALQQRQGLGA